MTKMSPLWGGCTGTHCPTRESPESLSPSPTQPSPGEQKQCQERTDEESSSGCLRANSKMPLKQAFRPHQQERVGPLTSEPHHSTPPRNHRLPDTEPWGLQPAEQVRFSGPWAALCCHISSDCGTKPGSVRREQERYSAHMGHKGSLHLPLWVAQDTEGTYWTLSWAGGRESSWEDLLRLGRGSALWGREGMQTQAGEWRRDAASPSRIKAGTEGEGLQPRVTWAPQPPAPPDWPPHFSCLPPWGPGQHPSPALAATPPWQEAAFPQPPGPVRSILYFHTFPRVRGPELGRNLRLGGASRMGWCLRHTGDMRPLPSTPGGTGRRMCHTGARDVPARDSGPRRYRAGGPESRLPLQHLCAFLEATRSWGCLPRTRAALPSAKQGPDHSQQPLRWDCTSTPSQRRQPAGQGGQGGAGLATTSVGPAASSTTKVHPAIRGPPLPTAE